MANRLKIGSYILDAAETGSTSTTTGAVLLEDFEGPNTDYETNAARMTFYAYMDTSGISMSTLKTRVAAIVAAVADNVNNDVVLEESAGGTQVVAFKTSDSSYQTISGSCRVEWGEETALLTIEITAERIGPAAASGGGLPAGSLDIPTWEIEQSVSGLLAIVGTIDFKTRADAIVFANGVRSSPASYLPAWVGTSMRQITFGFALNQQPRDVGPAQESDYNPCRLIVSLKQLCKSLQDSGLATDVKDFVCNLQQDERELDDRAAQEAGDTLTLALTVEFKTEFNATWNTSDTSAVTDAKSQADAIADYMLDQASTRYGQELIEIGRSRTLSISAGTVSIVLDLTTGPDNKVLEWNETTNYLKESRDLEVFDYLGAKTVFEHPAGMARTIEWTLTAKSLGSPVGVPSPAGLTPNYRLVRGGLGVPKRLTRGTGSAPAKWLVEGAGTWIYDEKDGPHADYTDKTTLPAKA